MNQASLRERVRCWLLVDWPVYPRLAHNMRATNDAQRGARLRNALEVIPLCEELLPKLPVRPALKAGLRTLRDGFPSPLLRAVIAALWAPTPSSP